MSLWDLLPQHPLAGPPLPRFLGILWPWHGRKPPCGQMGDVDDDGFVTLDDAKLIQQHITGGPQLTADQLSRAAVRGKAVDINDALFVAQYANHQRDTFPVCATVPASAGMTYDNVEDIELKDVDPDTLMPKRIIVHRKAKVLK